MKGLLKSVSPIIVWSIGPDFPQAHILSLQGARLTAYRIPDHCKSQDDCPDVQNTQGLLEWVLSEGSSALQIQITLWGWMMGFWKVIFYLVSKFDLS